MVNPAPAVSDAEPAAPLPWYRQLNGYHWLVLAVGTAAWSFDCFNQQIFNLARVPAMVDLLGTSPDSPEVTWYGNLGTSMLLIGWATGGIIFGIMGDRIGRAKTMLIMILAYSFSTGLCGLSPSPWYYIVFAFITGVGAGGIFPVACTLVAESLPDKARPQALGLVQMFSAVGNVSAGLIWLLLVQAWARHWIARDWPWLFAVGILPALLSVIVARRIREPDVWLKAKREARAGARKAGSLVELFGDRRWGPHAAVGLCLAVSGVVGLWGIGVFSNDLTQSFIGRQYDERMRMQRQDEDDLQFVVWISTNPDDLSTVGNRVKPKDLLGRFEKDEKHDHGDLDAKAIFEAANVVAAGEKRVSPDGILAELDRENSARTVQPHAQSAEDRLRREQLMKRAAAVDVDANVQRITVRQRERLVESRTWAAVTLAMFNVGGFFGMFAFALVTQWIGRRPTFALAFLVAGITTALVFLYMSKPADLFWMVPLMGARSLPRLAAMRSISPNSFPRGCGAPACRSATTLAVILPRPGRSASAI